MVEAKRAGHLLSTRRGLFGGLGAAVVASSAAGGYVWWAGNSTGLPGIEIDDFVAVEAGGTIAFACPAVEMGQGATTALPMVLAEEMGADLARIRVLPARRNAARYGNPDFDGRMVTADSKTTKGYFDLLRRAGVRTRLAFFDAARRLEGWSFDDMEARDHAVHHRPTGRSLNFAEIVARTTLSVPGSATLLPLKPRRSFTVIGSSPPLRDTLAKVTGKMSYGIDRRSPDALIAVVRRAPHLSGRPLEVRDGETRRLRGVVDTVLLDDGVAVAATDTWSALEGARRLDISWSQPLDFSDETCETILVAALSDDRDHETILSAKGDIREALSLAERRIVVRSHAPHVSHLAMEPMNAEARGTAFGLAVDIRSSTQSQDLDMMYGARNWKTAPFLVETETTPCGGAFGRRVLNDVVRDAARVAKALGRPVQVFRPLIDELRRGQVRPAAVHEIEVGTDPVGGLVAWHHRLVSDSVLARQIPSTFEARGRIDNTATDGMRHPYRTGAERLAWIHREIPVEPGFLRGVSAGHAIWAIETTVDRVAAAHSRDPLEWRLAHVDDPRGRAVLEDAALASGWGQADGRLRGLALMVFRESWVATVAEVTDEAMPRLIRLAISADVGLAIHPENVRRQIEGAAILGVSMAAGERLRYAAGRAEIDGVADYPVARCDALPQISVRLVGHDAAERPHGVGEIGVPTVAPAIANAFARRTGTWADRLPFAFDIVRT